jgi:hypothetical protein
MFQVLIEPQKGEWGSGGVGEWGSGGVGEWGSGGVGEWGINTEVLIMLYALCPLALSEAEGMLNTLS